MEKKPKNKKKIILISIISALLAIPLIILPLTTIIVYESIFGERYETVSWLEFSVEDYEGLQMERSDFRSEDVTLADYKSYVEDNGREYNAETKEEFMNGYLDKKQCFEPDPVLMEQILNMFDTYCTK